MSFLLLNSGGGDDLLLNNGDHLLLSGDLDLRWIPRHPDWIPPKPRLRTGSQRFLAINLDPIPRPSPPTELTWHPTFPDVLRARRSLRTAAQPARTSLLGPPISDLRWQPQYPDRVTRPAFRTTLQAAQAVLEIGAILDIPIHSGWRPRLPTHMPHPAAVFLGLPFLVDPDVILAAATCVEWTSETLTVPSLTAETLTSPSLTDEAVALPAMTEETLC